MSDGTTFDEALRTIASVLGWCFVFTTGMLLVWAAMLLLADDFIYRMHTHFFDITQNQMELAHYMAMAFFKMAGCVLFLFPYLAIRIVLRKR